MQTNTHHYQLTVSEFDWEIAEGKTIRALGFHLHGFFFQVLEVNNKKPLYNAWKDTINLPPKSTAKIAWIPDNRPGRWMYHCHILEHHAAGMMAHFEVVDPVKGSQHKPSMHSCHH